jgi:hypothetical protein
MSHGQFIPKWVAPPSGGWFHTPKNHHANGIIAFAGFFAILYGFYTQAERNTINPKNAYSLETVAKWDAAAAEKK